MKELSLEKMQQIEGGVKNGAECAYTITMGVLGIFGTAIPVLGAAVLIVGFVRPPYMTGVC